MKKSAKKAVKKTKRTKTAPSGGNGFHDASLYYGDCFDLMKEWAADGRRAEAADLIYLDPPFNSKAHYNILFGKGVNGNGNGNGASAQVMAFDDTWTWDEAAAERLDALLRESSYPQELKRTVEGLNAILGECGMLSYLTYMAERLHYCRRMLKPSGSIYLHCDPTASHYLKILMDAVFGRNDNFRNEIVWGYRKWTNIAQKFQQNHDILLFYSKSPPPAVFNFLPDPVPPPHPRYAKGYTTNRVPDKGRRIRQLIVYDKENPHAEQAIAAGNYDRVVYQDGYSVKLGDHWTDISIINSQAKERTGYPTQKPLSLLMRIIEASSNKGDLILDPFCGCGTTVVAAQKLGRRWCGIDISAFPVELIRARLHDIRGKIYVDGIPRDMKGARLLAKKPFEFEKWAIMQIPGMLPNAKQTGDGGVDGRGRLENDIRGAVKPPAAKTPLVIAQVTKSPGVNLNKIRALRSSMEEQKALFGVYITLERLTPTPAIRGILADAGRVKQGTSQYPRMQLYSIADYFNGEKPNLPPLATQRLLARGASKTSIQQHDLTL